MANENGDASCPAQPPSEPRVEWKALMEMEVCVPTQWASQRTEEFAEQQNPCGCKPGWKVASSKPCLEHRGFDLVILRCVYM